MARHTKPWRSMVRLVGFEPTTYGFEVRHSIQLSYRRLITYENDIYRVPFLNCLSSLKTGFCLFEDFK